MPITIRPFFSLRRLRGWGVLGALLTAFSGASVHAQRVDWEHISRLAQANAQQVFLLLPGLAQHTAEQMADAVEAKCDASSPESETC